jgi:hypothetical protein
VSITRTAVGAVAAIVLVAAPAVAQEPDRTAARELAATTVKECPTVETGSMPIELRIGGRVLRAEIRTDGGAAPGDSARVQARLVSCEDAGLRSAEADVEEPGAAAVTGELLRLLSDLRVGIQMAPSADGRCVRAQLDVRDDGPTRRAGPEQPLGVELCGLPFGREPAVESDAGSQPGNQPQR